MTSVARSARLSFVSLAIAVCAGPFVAKASDSLTWEWTPYRVLVSSQIEPSPQLPDEYLSAVWRRVEQRLRERMASAWRTTIVRDGSSEPASDVVDKRFVVRIGYEAGRYRIEVQETDAVTATVGPLVERSVVQREALDERLVDAIMAAFRPTILLDDVRGRSARIRFRAAGLFPEEELRRLTELNPAYQPFLRRLDREGRVQQCEEVPWTLVTFDEFREGAGLATIESGRSSPFGGTKRGRTERVGISVGRPTGTTTLTVVDRSGAPLVGARAVCDDADKPSGRTVPGDGRGRFTLAAADGRPQTVVVTSRFLPLAKVPVVPGMVKEQTLSVAADSVLFAAEERLMQWQSTFLDLHVRRRVLLMLASSYLDQEKPEAAGALLSALDQGERPSERIAELESLGRRLATDAGPSKRAVERMIADAAAAARELDDADSAAEVRGKLKQPATK